MRNATALSRFVATMIAAGVVLGGCGQAPTPPASDAGTSAALPYATSGLGNGAAGGADGPIAAGSPAKTRIGSDVNPASLPGGAVYRNPANGRSEVIVKDTSNMAVLIGDSQSEPAYGWTRQGLAAAGYKVYFC